MIRYGISKEYLPDWGYAEALREIYQNFDDYGNFDEGVVEAGYGNILVTLSNSFSPSNLNFLSIGNSAKRGDSNTVGEHGEGLKMALLVLARKNESAQVSSPPGIIPRVTLVANMCKLTPTFYNDEYLGRCFGLNINKSDVFTGFRLEFTLPKKDFDIFKGIQIDEHEIIYSHSYGDIIDKPSGSVYVGWIFIAVLQNMKNAYNFKPKDISLDRDRKIPRSFDVEWCASKIMEDWDELKIEDLDKRDASYISKIPKSIQKEFEPEITDDGVIFTAKGIKAPSSLNDDLKTFYRDDIADLKMKKNRTRKPENLLQKFHDTYEGYMSPDQKIDFEVLLKTSRNWVRKGDKE